MSKTRLVSAINNGTVIDHIIAGKAIKIMQLLHVVNDKQRVTIGLNLISKRLKLKDIIKIENRKLSREEINQISVFSPSTTISHIENFVVYEKIKCNLPEMIGSILTCPNLRCISRVEGKSYFKLESSCNEVSFYCFYCEKQFKNDHFEIDSV